MVQHAGKRYGKMKMTETNKAQEASTATLTDNATGQSWEFPILEGSTGPRVVDIRSLYNESGLFNNDPGFTSTTSCESAITYIHGDEGLLMHRGYRIEDPAEHSHFTEAC